jgi:hypothetical protein
VHSLSLHCQQTKLSQSVQSTADTEATSIIKVTSALLVTTALARLLV